MHSFHVLLRILTPPATATIGDTQCGFKLFFRPSLPYIIPYMHSEGWIFNVEMLMLAELADIPVAEVPIGWHEVKGSKLNVLWDTLGMAWGLAVLRAAWDNLHIPMARRSQLDEIREKCDNWLFACYSSMSMKIFRKHQKAAEESISAKQCCPYTRSGYNKLYDARVRFVL